MTCQTFDDIAIRDFTDYSLGFTVKIKNAPMRKIRNTWALDINREIYIKNVLYTIANANIDLTEKQVTFIYQYFNRSFNKDKPKEIKDFILSNINIDSIKRYDIAVL